MNKVIACFFALVFASVAEAQTVPTVILNVPSKAIYTKADADLTADIERAQTMLRTMTVGYTTKPIVSRVFKTNKKTKKKVLVRSKVVGHKLADYYIGLAVKRYDSSEIILVRIDRDGENNSGFEVDWSKLNGVNTKFLIEKPVGYAVLAIKRVVRIGKEYREVVYTPFSDEIDTPAMRRRGMEILARKLDAAYKDLSARDIRSHALPELNVHNVVPLRVALNLSIIEHIDPGRLRSETIEKLTAEVLVVVAANPERAYAYAVSRAGARGLFQFIPRTYAAIKRQYRSAGLVENFIHGMDDHVNAAKASLLLFDSDLSALPKGLRTAIIRNDDTLAEYLAIAYNSGSRRAVHAYTGGTIHTTGLPRETTVYVDKLRKVRSALSP